MNILRINLNKKTTANTWYKAWLSLCGFDTVESRPNLSFGRTLRLSSDRHDLIPPPLADIMCRPKICLH